MGDVARVTEIAARSKVGFDDAMRVGLEQGISAALALGVARTSLYRWRQRYAKGGIEALRDRPRGLVRECLPAWVEQAVSVMCLLKYRTASASPRSYRAGEERDPAAVRRVDRERAAR